MLNLDPLDRTYVRSVSAPRRIHEAVDEFAAANGFTFSQAMRKVLEAGLAELSTKSLDELNPAKAKQVKAVATAAKLALYNRLTSDEQAQVGMRQTVNRMTRETIDFESGGVPAPAHYASTIADYTRKTHSITPKAQEFLALYPE